MSVVILGLLASAVSVPASGAGGAGTAAAKALLGTSCTVFPADNYWHADISKLTLDKHSSQWLSHMSSTSHLHPDFGPSFGVLPVVFGIPYTVVAYAHATIHRHLPFAFDS